MNPEKQRIAIAEACGWKEVAFDYSGTGRYLFGHKPGVVQTEETHVDFPGLRMTLGRIAKTAVPDYPYDLNAMHEAEKVLTNEASWTVELYRVCEPTATHIARATAAQRAEAFLRTIGKWEED